jgi:hypothetical protein
MFLYRADRYWSSSFPSEASAIGINAKGLPQNSQTYISASPVAKAIQQ